MKGLLCPSCSRCHRKRQVKMSSEPYQHVTSQRGYRVFIWWSEGAGGHGLAGFGLCATVTHRSDEVVVDVETITVRRTGFGRADLRPFRDSPSMQPLAKLYRHALNKVVAISAEEEALLDRLILDALP